MALKISNLRIRLPKLIAVTVIYVGAIGLVIQTAQAQVGPTANFDWELEKRTYVTTVDAGSPIGQISVLQMPTLDQVPVPQLGGFKSPGGLPGFYSIAPIDTPINPQTFSVTLTSLSTPGDTQIVLHNWQIQGLNNGPVLTTGTGNPFTLSLARGAYDVTLFISDARGLSASIKKTVTVRDILVVSMGDSFSSGEGNPDEPEHWLLNIQLSDPVWQDTFNLDGKHSRCHRSLNSWSAQFATNLEQANKHTSVTFVHVACSGAEIGGFTASDPDHGGLIQPYKGIENDFARTVNTVMEPQVRQVLHKLCDTDLDPSVAASFGLSTIVGTCPHPNTMRKIDAMLISIGINDIHFSDIITDCIEHNALPLVDSCLSDQPDFDGNISNLQSTRYPHLKQVLDTVFPFNLRPQNTYIVEYPDPTHNPGTTFGFCDEGGVPVSQNIVLGYPNLLFPGGGDDVLAFIDATENSWLFSYALTNLDGAIKTAANSFGWNFIDRSAAGDILSLYRPHGYCTGLNRWFRTGWESSLIQGPNPFSLAALIDQKNTKGTIHPNIEGHGIIADAMFASYTAASDTIPPSATCNSDGLWHATDVTVQCTASDGGFVNASGLLNPDDGTVGFALSTHVPNGTETANALATGYTLCDYDLNCAGGTGSGNKIDKKAPTINISSPENFVAPAGPAGIYFIGQTVASNYGCTDGGSGLRSCTGPVTSGSNVFTATVGMDTFTVNAADNVNNASNSSVQYAVTYKVCPFYDSTKTYNTGSAIPIRVEICNASNRNLSSSSTNLVALTVLPANVPPSSKGSSNLNQAFRFEPKFSKDGGAYVYNLDTTGLAPGRYNLIYNATNDPILHIAPFTVVK
jgi:hypothetical protein